MPAFKDSFSATIKDAIKIQRRFQKTLIDESYLVGIFGSTVTKGKGHDIDVIITDCVGAKKNVDQIAWMLMVHCKTLHWWEVREHDEINSDLHMNFITHDDLYIDLLIRGLT